jgi:uncharacterized phage-associated protein
LQLFQTVHQKLLYYLQGFNIAVFNEKLFDEDIKAWQYGPVVPEVYSNYKEYSANGIPKEEFDLYQLGFSNDKLELFIDVFKIYNQYSAIKLMELTHNEMPWLKTPINEVISFDLLKDYFKTQLN